MLAVLPSLTLALQLLPLPSNPLCLSHLPAAPFTFELEGRLKGTTKVVLRTKGAGTPDPEDPTAQARLVLQFSGKPSVRSSVCGPLLPRNWHSCLLHSLAPRLSTPLCCPQVFFNFSSGFVVGKEYEFRARARNSVDVSAWGPWEVRFETVHEANLLVGLGVM